MTPEIILILLLVIISITIYYKWKIISEPKKTKLKYIRYETYEPV